MSSCRWRSVCDRASDRHPGFGAVLFHRRDSYISPNVPLVDPLSRRFWAFNTDSVTAAQSMSVLTCAASIPGDADRLYQFALTGGIALPTWCLRLAG